MKDFLGINKKEISELTDEQLNKALSEMRLKLKTIRARIETLDDEFENMEIEKTERKHAKNWNESTFSI